jgi:hypothetical protein
MYRIIPSKKKAMYIGLGFANPRLWYLNPRPRLLGDLRGFCPGPPPVLPSRHLILKIQVPKMNTATLFSMYRRQVMTTRVEIMKAQREFEDVKEVPPVDIILYRGTMNLRDLINLVRTEVSNLF